jgi:DNA mismatch endonuclease (patch repair protein)
MDKLTPERRSWNMSRIRGKNTKPELVVRSLLHRMGYRFRLNSDLPGKPDIVLSKYKTAVFVHGCFWHRHDGCPQCYEPKSRQEFWRKKFDTNLQRDKKVQQYIQDAGWNQLIVWECELKNIKALEKKFRYILHM